MNMEELALAIAVPIITAVAAPLIQEGINAALQNGDYYSSILNKEANTWLQSGVLQRPTLTLPALQQPLPGWQ